MAYSRGPTGIPPGSGWLKLAFVFSGLGSEQGLIASDLLGLDRDPLDPTRDVMAPMTTS